MSQKLKHYIDMLQDLYSDLNLICSMSPHLTAKRKIDILSTARIKAFNIDTLFPDGIEPEIQAKLDKQIQNNAGCDLITDGDGWRVGE